MQPRSANRSTRPAKKRKEEPLYGWRYVPHTLPDGRVERKQIPLTLEDVLHPQEGDVIPEKTQQAKDRTYLWTVFDTRLPRLHSGLILSDCIVDWGVPRLANHSPDLSVFDDLRVQPPPSMGIFRLRESGGRCLWVIEIVSLHTRDTDVVDKYAEYHRARVPLYVIVDQEDEDGPRQLLAYRWRRPGYRPEPLDERQRVLLAPLGLRLGLRDNRVVCWDADTDEEIPNLAGEQQARRAEAQARQEAERRAQAEAQARQAEAQARQEAERRAQAEAQARQAEAQARQEAERRARELEEQLRRLQAKPRKGKRPPRGG